MLREVKVTLAIVTDEDISKVMNDVEKRIKEPYKKRTNPVF